MRGNLLSVFCVVLSSIASVSFGASAPEAAGYEYSARFICSTETAESDSGATTPELTTTVAFQSRSAATVVLVSLSSARIQSRAPVPISNYLMTPDQTIAIDCDRVLKAHERTEHTDGYLLLQSDRPLTVTAAYESRSVGSSSSIDVESVVERDGTTVGQVPSTGPPTISAYDPDNPDFGNDRNIDVPAREFQSSELKGGKPAVPGAWPWAVLLTFNYNPDFIPFCSGALIGERWVLTAAHCAEYLWVDDMAWIGGTDLATDPGEPVLIESWKFNPAYDKSAKEGDLALVRLRVPSIASAHLSLPGADSPANASGQLVSVLGYGETEVIGGQLDATLYVLETSVVGQTSCQTSYPGGPPITPNIICAGGTGATTCTRDSGGPLFALQRRGRSAPQTTGVSAFAAPYEGLGVASFVDACATPGGFSRISSYIKWINDVVSGAP